MTQEDKKPNEEQESYGLVVQSKCFSNHLSLLEYNSYKMRAALEKFVRAYGHEKCVHTTLLAEAYEDAKAILTAPPEPIGNAAKMFETLERIVATTNDAELTDLCARELVADISMEALSEPLRNCDIGTAEEQDERFKNFCLSYYEPCNVDGECWRCPLFRAKTKCPIAWSQMPYKKGEADGDGK